MREGGMYLWVVQLSLGACAGLSRDAVAKSRRKFERARCSERMRDPRDPCDPCRQICGPGSRPDEPLACATLLHSTHLSCSCLMNSR